VADRIAHGAQVVAGPGAGEPCDATH
jgi:hypothetical protein